MSLVTYIVHFVKLYIYASHVIMMVDIAACPDVIVEDLTEEHEFMLLACDGIWDVLTNEEVVEYIRVRIAQEMEPEVVTNLFSYRY